MGGWRRSVTSDWDHEGFGFAGFGVVWVRQGGWQGTKRGSYWIPLPIPALVRPSSESGSAIVTSKPSIRRKMLRKCRQWAVSLIMRMIEQMRAK